MKKDRQYWLARGAGFPKIDGFACIGKGRFNPPLIRDLVGLNSAELFQDIGRGGCMTTVVEGIDKHSCYYIKTEKFDELFPVGGDYVLEIKIHDNAHFRLIQDKLYELGYSWNSGPKYLSAFTDFGGVFIHNDKLYWFNANCNIPATVISTDDVWKLQPAKPSSVEVKLNDSCTAVVYKDKIVFGGQTVSIDKLEELYNAAKTFK